MYLGIGAGVASLLRKYFLCFSAFNLPINCQHTLCEKVHVAVSVCLTEDMIIKAIFHSFCDTFLL